MGNLKVSHQRSDKYVYLKLEGLMESADFDKVENLSKAQPTQTLVVDILGVTSITGKSCTLLNELLAQSKNSILVGAGSKQVAVYLNNQLKPQSFRVADNAVAAIEMIQKDALLFSAQVGIQPQITPAAMDGQPMKLVQTKKIVIQNQAIPVGGETVAPPTPPKLTTPLVDAIFNLGTAVNPPSGPVPVQQPPGFPTQEIHNDLQEIKRAIKMLADAQWGIRNTVDVISVKLDKLAPDINSLGVDSVVLNKVLEELAALRTDLAVPRAKFVTLNRSSP